MPATSKREGTAPVGNVRNLFSDYFDQVFQLPPVICGRQLKPLSIGRYRMMSQFDLAFVSEEERVATAWDLMMGVMACSMSTDEFIELITAIGNGHSISKKITKWGCRWGFFAPGYFSIPVVGRYLRRIAWWDVAAADARSLMSGMDKFIEYIRTGSKAPDYWDEAKDGTVSAAHWSQSIEVVLRGNLGWTQQEINEEPLGKALWDYFKFMENQGVVRLLTPEQAKANSTPLTKTEAAQATEEAQKALEFMRARRGQGIGGDDGQ